MKEYHYFECADTLANIAPAFGNGLWTVTCPTCGAVNKLARDPKSTNAFVVCGAYFVTRTAPLSTSSLDAALACS